MSDLSLRVYLENGSDAMRGGWLELPVAPERLDAFMRGVVGVDDGGRSGLEDAVAALEAGAAVMDPADPTNMAVTAAESGRAL